MKKTNLLLLAAIIMMLHLVSFKSNAQWNLNGNSVISTNFIGTTNNSSLRFRVNNQQRMILDSLGRLGIGTAFPTDVVDAFDGTNHTLIGGNQIRFTRTGNPSYISASGNGGYLNFITNGRATQTDSANLTLFNDFNSAFHGKVGIGTNSPSGLLDIRQGTGVGVGFGTALNIYDGNDKWGLTEDDGVARQRNEATGGYDWWNAAGTKALMTLINTGNLGIGTASPSGKLSVVKVGGLDDILTLADDSNSLTIGTDSDLPAFMRIRPTKGTGIAITNNGDNVGLFVKSDASTNVGIGTSAPDSKLHIKSNGSTLSTNAFRVQNGSSAQLFVVRDDGRIGIGLGSPAAKLHIKAAGSGATGVTVRIQNSSSKELFTIKDDGKVGIGLTVPTSELDVVGDAHFNTANTTDCDLRLQTLATNMGWFAGGGSNRLALYNYATSTTLMEVLGNGNIGIGTTNAVYKLDVCGTIRGKEVRVETGWCDYVFNQDYKLPALNEVEEFIKVNKHLPDVTPGNIIETEGLEVGKMSAQMIKKIEELTLYVIQLSKQNNSLQQQIEELKNK